MKTGTYAKTLVLFGMLLSVSNAFAGRSDLINSALNASLSERSRVQRVYETNESAKRPEDASVSRSGRRIEVEVGAGVVGTVKASKLKSYDRGTAGLNDDESALDLDRELNEINKPVEFSNSVAKERRGISSEI